MVWTKAKQSDYMRKYQQDPENKNKHNKSSAKSYQKHKKNNTKKLRDAYKVDKNRFKRNGKKYRETLSGKFCYWRSGAKERKIEWDLTLEDLESLPMICAFTKTKLTLKQHSSNTVSLDRIDSNKGYIKGNVQFVSVQVNYAKSDYTEKEFISMCKKVAELEDSYERPFKNIRRFVRRPTGSGHNQGQVIL